MNGKRAKQLRRETFAECKTQQDVMNARANYRRKKKKYIRSSVAKKGWLQMQENSELKTIM